jgi:hypothetical protein
MFVQSRTWAVIGACAWVLLFCAVAAACDGELAAPAAQTAECPPPSTLTAQAELASESRVLVEATVYDRARCLPAGIRNFWGSTDLPVERVVGDLRISINREEVWVPLSSYSDLGDPSAVTIEDIGSQAFTVLIRGEGDSGYYARLRVERNTVVSRHLFGAGFEGDAGEVARYSYTEDL